MSDEVALAELRSRCEELGLSLEQALREKTYEVAARALLMCIPNEILLPHQIPSYLKRVGRTPTEALVEQVRSVRRGPRLTSDEVVVLEQRQRLRCALCGTVLDSDARRHVDHIVPVALGGKSVMSNYQLLCRRCNLGKSVLLSWVLGIPFQARSLSSRLRYCVLAAAGARCQVKGCEESSKTNELMVIRKVSASEGGQMIYDNLMVMCRFHGEAAEAKILKHYLNTLKLAKAGRILLRAS